MEIIELDDVGKFAAYEDALDDLLRRSHGKHLYMTFDYIYSWLTSFGCDTFKIILVKDKGAITGFLPIARSGQKYHAKTSVYTMAGEGLWGYADIVADDDYRKGVVGAILDHLFKTLKFGKLEIGPLHYNSPNLPIMREYLADKRRKMDVEIMHDSPFIDTRMDFNSYLKNKLTRKSTLPDVNRCMRRLGEMGCLTYRKIDRHNIVTEKELVGYLDKFFEMYNRQWEQNRFKKNRKFYDLYVNFAVRAQKKGYLECSMLYLGESIIAFHYGFLFNNCRYYFTPTYDITYKKYSPGKILLYYLIKDSFEQKVEFDFMNSPEPYKLEWTDTIQKRVMVKIYADAMAKAYFHLASIYRKIKP